MKTVFGRQSVTLLLLFLLCLILLCVVCVIFRSTTSTQQELYKEPASVFLITGNGLAKDRRLDRIGTNDIVFNQGTSLGLPHEYLIANPNLNVEYMKEIAKEILPEFLSLHNFVVIN